MEISSNVCLSQFSSLRVSDIKVPGGEEFIAKVYLPCTTKLNIALIKSMTHPKKTIMIFVHINNNLQASKDNNLLKTERKETQ